MRALVLSLCLATGAIAQAVRTIGPDPAVVRLGDATHLTVRIEDHADAELGPLPNSGAFEISAESQRRIEFDTMRDGRVERNSASSWRIRLRPREAGRLTVPSFVVVAGGRTLRTSDELWVDVVHDATGTELAFVEWDVSRSRCFHGESVGVVLRFGIRDTLFERGLLPLSRQSLDVPLHLSSRWIQQRGDSIRIGSVDGPVTVALNGATVEATRLAPTLRGERRFTTFGIPLEFDARDTGPHELPPALLRFAFATRFEDSLFDPVPRDRHEAIVYAEPRRLVVDELPSIGRPPAFRGAVGEFRVKATCDVRETRVGRPFYLDLVLEGPGNHASLGAPDLDLPSFHVYSREVERAERSTRVRYELAALGPVDRVPAIEFVFFDPTTRGYRVARTEPIALRVDGAADEMVGAATSRHGEIHGLLPMDAASHAPRTDELSWWILVAGFGLPWVVAALASRMVRRIAADRADPRRRAARLARKRLRRALGRGDRPLREVVIEYLAARLRREPAAVVGPDLERRLHESGVDVTLSTEVATLVRTLVDADYGGTALACDRVSVLELAERLESALGASRVKAAVALVIVLASPGLAQSAAERGVLEYAAGRFDDAQATFAAAALDAGDRSGGPLLYNAGNAAYCAGRYAEARWLYLRAALRMPGEARVRSNLRAAERRLGIAPPPRTLGASIADWTRRRTPDELVLLVSAFLTIACVAGALAGRRTRMRFVARTAALASMVALVGIGIGYGATNRSSGVVLERAAIVHSEPHASRATSDTVRPGTLVRTGARSDRWVEVDTRARRGWVRRERIGLLE